MTYRKEYALGILALMPLLAAGTFKGIGWLVTIVMVYVGVPLLVWSLLVDRLAVLVIGIIRRFRESSGHQYYFEKPVERRVSPGEYSETSESYSSSSSYPAPYCPP